TQINAVAAEGLQYLWARCRGEEDRVDIHLLSLICADGTADLDHASGGRTQHPDPKRTSLRERPSGHYRPRQWHGCQGAPRAQESPAARTIAQKIHFFLLFVSLDPRPTVSLSVSSPTASRATACV